MTKSCDYITVESAARIHARAVVRMPSYKKSPAQFGNRTFVPFAGFDGQKLAGTGALVWEGELLEERKH